MLLLLRQGDGRLLGPYAYLQARAARVDREVPVAQAPDQIEGLPCGLLLRKPQRVLCHRCLDRRAHLRRGTEEPIRGREPFQPLVRALEVVVLNEQRRAPLAIVEVGEHGAREELLPHRLPEALDLAAGLRVVRAALHMPNAVAPKLLLEARLAAPRGVLASLIGQDLARRPVIGDTPVERLHHKRAPLMVRHH